MRRLSKNSKSYKTAATLFSISGLLFIILAMVTGKIGIYLPIGIALVVISMGFRQRSRKPTDNHEEKPEYGDPPPNN